MAPLGIDMDVLAHGRYKDELLGICTVPLLLVGIPEIGIICQISNSF